jgi:hypothetical protein
MWLISEELNLYQNYCKNMESQTYFLGLRRMHPAARTTTESTRVKTRFVSYILLQ